MHSEIRQAIDRATQPGADISSISDVCQLINSRLDVQLLSSPKQAALYLRQKLMSRNLQVQQLAVQVLEQSVASCNLRFHTQIASKEMTQTISQLIKSKAVSTSLQTKLIRLVQTWGRRFQQNSDILPGFTNLYQQLKSTGVQFPNEPIHSRQKQSGGSLQQTRVPNITPQKTEKLKKDLEVVRENVELANQMIDQADPREDLKNNEVLVQLAQTLKAMNGKLGNLKTTLIGGQVYELVVMYLEQTQETLQRFDSLKSGRKPKSFRRNKSEIPNSAGIHENLIGFVQPIEDQIISGDTYTGPSQGLLDFSPPNQNIFDFPQSQVVKNEFQDFMTQPVQTTSSSVFDLPQNTGQSQFMQAVPSYSNFPQSNQNLFNQQVDMKQEFFNQSNIGELFMNQSNVSQLPLNNTAHISPNNQFPNFPTNPVSFVGQTNPQNNLFNIGQPDLFSSGVQLTSQVPKDVFNTTPVVKSNLSQIPQTSQPVQEAPKDHFSDLLNFTNL